MGMVWQIPAASLEKVERRKRGPKPAESAGTGGDGQSASMPVKAKRRVAQRSSAKKATMSMNRNARKGDQ